MLVPIRCFTCGKPLGDKWETFLRRIREEKFKKEIDLNEDEDQFIDLTSGEFVKTISGNVMDELGLVRYCCRIQMFTTIDLSEEISY